MWGHPQLISLLKYPGVKIFIDCTFSVCPPKFYQYLILMVYDSPTKLYVPAFYVLMTKKSEEAYYLVFMKLAMVCNWELKPGSISCDFEKGLINSIKSTFPKGSIIGCLFHF